MSCRIPQSPEPKKLSDSTMASADIAGLLAAADEHNIRSSSRQGTAGEKQQQPASSISSDISALLAHAEAAEREIVGKRCVAHPP